MNNYIKTFKIDCDWLEDVSFEASVLLSIIMSARADKQYTKIDENGEVYCIVPNSLLTYWLPFLKKDKIADLFSELEEAGYIRKYVKKTKYKNKISSIRKIYINANEASGLFIYITFPEEKPLSWYDVYRRLGITIFFYLDDDSGYIDKDELYTKCYLPDDMLDKVLKIMLDEDLIRITEDSFVISDELETHIKNINNYWINVRKKRA